MAGSDEKSVARADALRAALNRGRLRRGSGARVVPLDHVDPAPEWSRGPMPAEVAAALRRFGVLS